MVEHVFGGLAEIDDPFGDRRRLDAERHVLGVSRAGGMIIAADSADAAGDEVGVARIFSLHENAVSAENRRSAVTLGDFFLLEVDLSVNAEAPDDTGNRVPRHFNKVSFFS